MKYSYHTIKDKITGKFTFPQLSDNRERFIANFVLNRMETDKAFKPEEFETAEIAEWDDEKGELSPKTPVFADVSAIFEIWQNRAGRSL